MFCNVIQDGRRIFELVHSLSTFHYLFCIVILILSEYTGDQQNLVTKLITQNTFDHISCTLTAEIHFPGQGNVEHILNQSKREMLADYPIKAQGKLSQNCRYLVVWSGRKVRSMSLLLNPFRSFWIYICYVDPVPQRAYRRQHETCN